MLKTTTKWAALFAVALCAQLALAPEAEAYRRFCLYVKTGAGYSAWARAETRQTIVDRGQRREEWAAASDSTGRVSVWRRRCALLDRIRPGENFRVRIYLGGERDGGWDKKCAGPDGEELIAQNDRWTTLHFDAWGSAWNPSCRAVREE